MSVTDRLITAHRELLLIREVEEAVLRCAADGLVAGAVHPCTGQEAVAVGTIGARHAAEWVVSYYRCHGHALAAGCDPGAVLREVLGRVGALCGGKGGSMHLADRAHRLLGSTSIVGAQLPIAAGVAHAEQAAGSGRAVLVFCGDGALAAGPVLETFGIAARLRLPLLVVCEDNGWQDHTASHLVRHLAPEQVAAGFGIPHQVVDGNDVLAVREATDALVGPVRAGAGPALLVARTWLRDFHSSLGRSRPGEYRPADERAHWAERDPIEQAGRRLVAAGIDRRALAATAAEVRAEVDAALAAALAAPVVDPRTARTDVTTASSTGRADDIAGSGSCGPPIRPAGSTAPDESADPAVAPLDHTVGADLAGVPR